MLKRLTGLTIFFLISGFTGMGQIKDIGTPFIRNFSKTEYKAGTQTWSVAQDLKGFMYFANNEGLLVFDGVQWELYKLPNFSIMRSIYIDDKGEIYIGAYNEFGKMVPGNDGKLKYQSLKNLIPHEYQNFDDVWNISPYKDKIIFQSYNALYIYKENEPLIVVKAHSRFQVSDSVPGRVLVNDETDGLMEVSGNTLIPVPGFERLKGVDISAILPFDNSSKLLICTISKGLFYYNGSELNEWNIPVNELLVRSQVFSATTLQKDYFALGTIQDGVIMIDMKGNLVQHINSKKGLQNNTVLKTFSDRSGNLWLGLDNGIDYIAVSSPITFLKNPEGFGAGYAELIHNGKLYLGTNQGLYVCDWQNEKTTGEFRMIPGTFGQVWYLGIHNGVIICGHNYGTFAIDGEKATLINNIQGGWKYHILSKYPGYLIGGTYSGLILFRWENNMWKFERRIKGFNESFRVFEEDNNGDLWMSHGFKGLFKVRINETLDSVIMSKYYTKQDGLPTNYTLNVFRIKERLIFTGDTTGIYVYVPQTDRFELSPYYNELLSPVTGFTYLKEDKSGNIWYISYNKIGLFRIQENYSFIHLPSPFTLLAGKFIHGFESVYPYSGDQVIISIENGFAHYSPHEYRKNYPDFSAYITKIQADYIDSAIYPGRRASSLERSLKKFIFPFKNNHLRFYFSSPVYDNPGNIEYSCKLSGYDGEWSRWSNSYFKDYNRLPDGRFTFLVKARNPLGIESMSDSIDFTILPPWYKSIAAYISYVVLLIVLVIIFIWLDNVRIEVSRRKERVKQQKEYQEREREYIRQALISEKKIITMKNEKLQTEKILRDKELANQAMDIVRKNEFLMKIKEELLLVKNSPADGNAHEKVGSIISRINREVAHTKQREVFDKAFDEVHESFLNRLKSSYPTLTPTELRLCAYLKMNISTKEIAPLMNISLRGVEICRYRIRKKLGINRNTNLTGFLLNR